MTRSYRGQPANAIASMAAFAGDAAFLGLEDLPRSWVPSRWICLQFFAVLFKVRHGSAWTAECGEVLGSKFTKEVH